MSLFIIIVIFFPTDFCLIKNKIIDFIKNNTSDILFRYSWYYVIKTNLN